MKKKGSCHCQKVVWELEVETPLEKVMYLVEQNHLLVKK